MNLKSENILYVLILLTNLYIAGGFAISRYTLAQ